MIQKVVHLVYSFGCGGLEKVIVNLINRSHSYNVEHIIISLTDDLEMSEQLETPVKIFSLGKKSGNDFKSHKKLLALLREHKPDTIQTYNFGTIEYHITAYLAGVPNRIHSDHGRGGDDPNGANSLHNIFRKFISFFLHHYVVVSYDLLSWVTNSLNVSQKKVQLVYNGVDVPKNVKYINKPPKVFITVGRLDAVKNQELLINAFAKFVNSSHNNSHFQLNIVGNGPLYEQLSQQIIELGMENNITLLGYRSDIPCLLKAADVFVLSSNYEAMPMTILEAMALKLPVICTRVGGIAKFISENEAWFVEPRNIDSLANHFTNVVDELNAGRSKSEMAYNMVKEKYSVESMVSTYMDMYRAKKL